MSHLTGTDRVAVTTAVVIVVALAALTGAAIWQQHTTDQLARQRAECAQLAAAGASVAWTASAGCVSVSVDGTLTPVPLN